MTLTRRAFLGLSALSALALAGWRFVAQPARAAACVTPPSVLRCWVRPGTALPMSVPTVVGDDCAPPPTPVPSATATATQTATATGTATLAPTATATPSPTATPKPVWRLWFPLDKS